MSVEMLFRDLPVGCWFKVVREGKLVPVYPNPPGRKLSKHSFEQYETYKVFDDPVGRWATREVPGVMLDWKCVVFDPPSMDESGHPLSLPKPAAKMSASAPKLAILPNPKPKPKKKVVPYSKIPAGAWFTGVGGDESMPAYKVSDKVYYSARPDGTWEYGELETSPDFPAIRCRAPKAAVLKPHGKTAAAVVKSIQDDLAARDALAKEQAAYTDRWAEIIP